MRAVNPRKNYKLRKDNSQEKCPNEGHCRNKTIV
jgi:hypothetical protein